MEFEVLERTEHRLEIKVLDSEASVMYPMIEQLIEDERVEDANFSVEHPELDAPVLTIEAKEGEDSKEIFMDVTGSIRDKFSNLYSQLFEEEE